MKKSIVLVLVIFMTIIALTSCASVAQAATTAGAKNVEYDYNSYNDIYGSHVQKAILVDQHTEGIMANAIFETRLLRDTLDGKTEGYKIDFRRQVLTSGLNYYEMMTEPVLKVDGKIFEFPFQLSETKASTSDLLIDEKVYTLTDEMIEALKNAEMIFVQFYTINDKVQVQQYSKETLDGIKSFLK